MIQNPEEPAKDGLPIACCSRLSYTIKHVAIGIAISTMIVTVGYKCPVYPSQANPGDSAEIVRQAPPRVIFAFELLTWGDQYFLRDTMWISIIRIACLFMFVLLQLVHSLRHPLGTCPMLRRNRSRGVQTIE